MAQMISGKDLARLHHDFEVPQLLSAILDRREILSTHEENQLRAHLAQMNALESLISLACCFHVFLPYLGDDRTLTEPLVSHADYILDDYAPYWMKQSFPADEEWTNFVHEDLETLADFLGILSDAAHGMHPAISDICEILNEQAFLKSVSIDIVEVVPPKIRLSAPKAPVYTDNVIRFPTERRA